MKIDWTVTSKDKYIVNEIVKKYQDDPLVKDRYSKNIERKNVDLSEEEIWKTLIQCLITSNQKSGPDSNVDKFLNQRPFPLSVKTLKGYTDNHLDSYIVKSFEGKGLRFINKLPEQVRLNYRFLFPSRITSFIQELRGLFKIKDRYKERRFAIKLQGGLGGMFKGIGPKQSRNFLQSLGLARYEIPVDSRVTNWINKNGLFPVKLSSMALGDENYFEFVLDGIAELCKNVSIYPCILDASVFVSFNKGKHYRKEFN